MKKLLVTEISDKSSQTGESVNDIRKAINRNFTGFESVEISEIDFVNSYPLGDIHCVMYEDKMNIKRIIFFSIGDGKTFMIDEDAFISLVDKVSVKSKV